MRNTHRALVSPVVRSIFTKKHIAKPFFKALGWISVWSFVSLNINWSSKTKWYLKLLSALTFKKSVRTACPGILGVTNAHHQYMVKCFYVLLSMWGLINVPLTSQIWETKQQLKHFYLFYLSQRGTAIAGLTEKFTVAELDKYTITLMWTQSQEPSDTLGILRGSLRGRS